MMVIKTNSNYDSANSRHTDIYPDLVKRIGNDCVPNLLALYANSIDIHTNTRKLQGLIMRQHEIKMSYLSTTFVTD
jgi:hypothetical protein